MVRRFIHVLLQIAKRTGSIHSTLLECTGESCVAGVCVLLRSTQLHPLGILACRGGGKVCIGMTVVLRVGTLLAADCDSKPFQQFCQVHAP